MRRRRKKHTAKQTPPPSPAVSYGFFSQRNITQSCESDCPPAKVYRDDAHTVQESPECSGCISLEANVDTMFVTMPPLQPERERVTLVGPVESVVYVLTTRPVKLNKHHNPTTAPMQTRCSQERHCCRGHVRRNYSNVKRQWSNGGL